MQMDEEVGKLASATPVMICAFCVGLEVKELRGKY